MPFTLCVVRSIITLFQTLNHSGWWFMASATRATRVMLPKAATKSLQVYSWCSLPWTIFQPGNLERSACISPSVNFFAGIVWSSGSAGEGQFHYVPSGVARQDSGGDRFTAWLGGLCALAVECLSKFHYRRGFFCGKNAPCAPRSAMDGGNREKEDSSDSIRHWAHRRVDRSPDAREAGH